MNRTRRSLGTALVAVLTLGTATAHAQVEKYDSRATIGIAVPLYHGKVKADVDRCVRNRRVRLFERRPGPDGSVGGDRTNRRGRWKVEVPVEELEPQDRFYAKVRRKLNIVSGEGYLCRGDRSKTVTFVGD
ncbi:MAG: hypothetical protein ACRDSN_10750 [Pseudonocardiaceae bacterium]